MKKTISALLTIVALAFAATTASADHHANKMAPKTVIHVVTVSWKDDATPAQIKAALDGVHQLAKDYAGITRVWTRTVKAQGNRSHAFVMEFKDEKALADYAGSDAQKKWYEVYYGARAGSTTFDISN